MIIAMLLFMAIAMLLVYIAIPFRIVITLVGLFRKQPIKTYKDIAVIQFYLSVVTLFYLACSYSTLPDYILTFSFFTLVLVLTGLWLLKPNRYSAIFTRITAVIITGISIINIKNTSLAMQYTEPECIPSISPFRYAFIILAVVETIVFLFLLINQEIRKDENLRL